MRNLKKISDLTKSINQKDRTTWVDCYYSIEKKAVYSRPGAGLCKVCTFINYNAPEDVKDAVEWWLRQ